MITMDKQALRETLFLYVSRLDEDSDDYARFCDIVLRLIGVILPDDTLAPAYADSPFWTGGDDGTPLRPSVISEIATMIPTNQWGTLSPELAQLISDDDNSNTV